ncbi:hypothetical protein D3C76_1709380 [compost metagenome]
MAFFLPLPPPPIPPIIPENCFIMRRISSNCLMRRFTSVSEVPLPAAIRLRRLWLMISGWAFSCFVMEWTIASTRPICLSSTLRSFMPFALFMPGSISRI